MEYIKLPFRAATSPTAKRTYLGTFLFVSAAVVLMCFAALAYPVLYYNYVPKKVVNLPVHLQYNTAPNPYGIISLMPDLMREQAYDVSVELTLPRSPANLERGNFMIALYAMKSTPENPALFPPPTVTPSGPITPDDLYTHVTKDNTVFSSRRPVLIPYEDPLVSLVSRVLFMGYHIVFGSRKTHSDTLKIPMGELVEFRGVLPLSIFLDVQAGQDLQVYSCEVTLVARLSGFRWFMYNHRILAFFAFTSVFWLVEILGLGVAWVLFGVCVSGRGGQGKKETDVIKTDDRRQQQRLNPGMQSTKAWDTSDDRAIKGETDDYDDDIKVKDESTEEQTLIGSVPRSRGYGDADDEDDEEEDTWKDRGSGTGLEKKPTSLRRRSSRGGTY